MANQIIQTGTGRVGKGGPVLFPTVNEAGQWLARTRADGSTVVGRDGKPVPNVYALLTLLANTGMKKRDGSKIVTKTTLRVTSWTIIQLILNYAPKGTEMWFCGPFWCSAKKNQDGTWGPDRFNVTINGLDGRLKLMGRSKAGELLTENVYRVFDPRTRTTTSATWAMPPRKTVERGAVVVGAPVAGAIAVAPGGIQTATVAAAGPATTIQTAAAIQTAPVGGVVGGGNDIFEDDDQPF